MNPNSTGGGTEIPKKKQIPSSDGDEDEFGVLSPIEKNELIQSERFQNLLLSSATLHQHFANNYSSNSNSSSNSAAANAGKNNSKQGKISNFSAEEDDETGTDNTTSLVIKSNRGMPSEEFYSTDPTDSSDGEGDESSSCARTNKEKMVPHAFFFFISKLVVGWLVGWLFLFVGIYFAAWRGCFMFRKL